jgi:hypothetical protein
MPASLIVGRRPPAPGALAFHSDSLQESIKGEIKIKPRLLSVCDHIQACFQLIGDGHSDSIINHFLAIISPKSLKMLDGMMEPGRERVTSHNSGPKGDTIHDTLSP